MPERFAVGTFDPVVYFESPTGEISLPGTTEENQRGQNGWIRRQANTLKALDALQRRMEEQDRRDMRARLDRDEMVFEEKRRKTRESLLRTITKRTTSRYEREFISEYLQLSDERKRKFYNSDKAIKAYFMAREFEDCGKALLEG
jgi:hypothetical protein